MKLFSTLIKVCRGTSSSYFKINVPFFCCPLFVKEYLDPLVTIKKMVNQQCRLPPWSFKINLKDKSFHISIDSLGLYLTPEYLQNFLSELYIPAQLGKIFQNHAAQITGKCICELKKIESRHFYSSIRPVQTPQFLSSPSRQTEITYSPCFSRHHRQKDVKMVIYLSGVPDSHSLQFMHFHNLQNH